MKFPKTFFIPLLAVSLLAGCNNGTVDPGDQVNPVEIPAEVANATSEFALGFFKQIQIDEATRENIFVSPLSLHIALGMLANGADSTTADQLFKALHAKNIPLATLNDAYQTLINKLPEADSRVALNLANSAWYNQSKIQVEQDYQYLLQRSFNASINGSSFDNTTVSKINQWASDMTNKKIPKVLERIEEDQVLFLINALYFKGNWKFQFDPAQTADTPFKLENGISKNVKMMFVKGSMDASVNEGFNAVRLPYANGQFNMTLIIPTGDRKIRDVLGAFTNSSWTSLQTSQLRAQNVTVGLPRFTLNYEAKLNNTLKSLGIRDAFDENANFNKISKSSSLFVDFVKQNTFLGIDEQGTEAAAVTTIGRGVTSAPPDPRLICDRPFGLIISEKTSNTILFMGQIKNPDSK